MTQSFFRVRLVATGAIGQCGNGQMATMASGALVLCGHLGFMPGSANTQPPANDNPSTPA